MAEGTGDEDSLFLPEIEGTFWFDTLEGLLPREPTLQPAAPNSVPAQTSLDAAAGSIPTASGTSSNPESETAPAPRGRGRGCGRGRGRGRGRAKSVDPDVEEKRTKNREIQARYRARQKAMRDELEEAHERLAVDLEREQAENEMAAEKNALLEKQLFFRDQAVMVLEARGSSRDLRPSSSGDTLQSDGSVPRPLVQSVYQRLSSDLGSPIQSIVEAYVVTAQLDDGREDEMEDPNLSALASTVKELTGEQLVRGWQTFALMLKDIIEDVGPDRIAEYMDALASTERTVEQAPELDYVNPPEPLTQVIPLFQEQVVVLGSALKHNLPAVQELFATASDVVPPGGDAPAKWRQIVEGMQLTESQRAKVLSHYNIYQSKMRKLAKQRQDVAQTLAAQTTSTAAHITSLHHMMEEYLSLFDSSGKVAAEPNAELLAMLDLMRSTGRVFTMIQKVKMVAAACPAFPDTVQLMRAVAAMSMSEDVLENSAPTAAPIDALSAEPIITEASG